MIAFDMTSFRIRFGGKVEDNRALEQSVRVCERRTQSVRALAPPHK